MIGGKATTVPWPFSTQWLGQDPANARFRSLRAILRDATGLKISRRRPRCAGGGSAVPADDLCSIERLIGAIAQRSDRIIPDDALGGEPRIDGHRLGVLQIHEEVEPGDTTPSEFAARYYVDVAAVYRALAYYHKHPNEIETVRQ